METCNQCHGINPDLSAVAGRNVCRCGDTQERVARIRVTAPVGWITNNGESSTDAGFGGLQEVMEANLHRLLPLCYREEGVKVEFLEWEE